MNYQALRDELALPAYEGLTDQQAANLLNAKTVSQTQPISSAELLAWSGAGGRFQRIADAADNTALPGEVRSLAHVARELIRRDGTSLDLSLPDRVGLLDGLVAASILTADDKTSLEELAVGEPISRATELGIRTVKTGYVQKARA